MELAEPSVELQTYSGEPIQLCGMTQVPVKHKGQTVALPLVGSGPALLGRNLLEALQLDWHKFKKCWCDILMCSKKNWVSSVESQPRFTLTPILSLNSRKLNPSHLRYVIKSNRNLTDFRALELSSRSNSLTGLRQIGESESVGIIRSQ